MKYHEFIERVQMCEEIRITAEFIYKQLRFKKLRYEVPKLRTKKVGNKTLYIYGTVSFARREKKIIPIIFRCVEFDDPHTFLHETVHILIRTQQHQDFFKAVLKRPIEEYLADLFAFKLMNVKPDIPYIIDRLAMCGWSLTPNDWILIKEYSQSLLRNKIFNELRSKLKENGRKRELTASRVFI